MTKFKPADGGSNLYDLGAAINAALKGAKISGYTAEVSQELARKHGGEGVRVPLSALAQVKATGSTSLIPGAVPLNDFSLEGGIAEVGSAIRREMLATKFGVTTRSTDSSEYRIPIVTTKPTAQIVDVDQALTDSGNSNFDYVSVKPVVVGTMVEISNSLDFSNPDAVAMISKQIVDVVSETIDGAFLVGYGPTNVGRSFAGILNSAVPTGVTLTTTSTLAAWGDVKEAYCALTRQSDVSNARWLMSNLVADKILAVSPIFPGSSNSIATGRGVDFLLGTNVVYGRLPLNVVGGVNTSKVLFGEPGETFLVLFDSASISLTANPYEAAAFAKGSTWLRVMVSFGMAMRDPRRLVSAVASPL